MEEEAGKEMLITKRKPLTVGEILLTEFMRPMSITETELADKTGIPPKHIDEIIRNRRTVTADTALILSNVFGNSAEFWINTQRRFELWEKQKRNLQDLEHWKAQAKRSKDGRYDLGDGWSIQYREEPKREV